MNMMGLATGSNDQGQVYFIITGLLTSDLESARKLESLAMAVGNTQWLDTSVERDKTAE